jgi:lysophospholipase L1-like esterase
VCAGVGELIRRVHADRPGLLVGILGVLPRAPGPFASGLTEAELMLRVDTLNQGMQSLVASMPGVVYASCWHELCDSSREGLMNKQFFEDYVHLNNRGYAVLTAAILRLIQRLQYI